MTADAEVLNLKVVHHAIPQVAQLVAAVCELAVLSGIAGLFFARPLFIKA